MNDHDISASLRTIHQGRAAFPGESELQRRVRGIEFDAVQQEQRPLELPGLSIRPSFSSASFAIAAAIVALLGSVMLAGVLTRPAAIPASTPDGSGTFSAIGSLAQPRAGHSATLLPDGRVLVVGGFAAHEEGTTAAAEVWDPENGTFSPTGSLALGRAHHDATLLPDGRVLVTGGEHVIVVEDRGVHVDLTSAEIWDPSTGTFSPGGSPALDWIASTTLLPDGRALVVGRLDRGDESSPHVMRPAASIWSPATNTFNQLRVVLGADYYDATALADGRLLIIDDEDPTEDGYAGAARVWVPVTDSLLPAGSPALSWHSPGTLLADGRVLFVGFPSGCDDLDESAPGCTMAAEVWDPETMAFRAAGSIPGTDRDGFTLTALADGGALLAGGCGYTHGCYDTAAVWDPETATFDPTGSVAAARSGHTATALPDGRVLVVGGWDHETPAAHASAEVWEASEG